MAHYWHTLISPRRSEPLPALPVVKVRQVVECPRKIAPDRVGVGCIDPSPMWSWNVAPPFASNAGVPRPPPVARWRWACMHGNREPDRRDPAISGRTIPVFAAVPRDSGQPRFTVRGLSEVPRGASSPICPA